MKATDEGEYKVVVENEHGMDEKTFMLYVSGMSYFFPNLCSGEFCRVDIVRVTDQTSHFIVAGKVMGSNLYTKRPHFD